jgi:hypothetical protein
MIAGLTAKCLCGEIADEDAEMCAAMMDDYSYSYGDDHDDIDDE